MLVRQRVKVKVKLLNISLRWGGPVVESESTDNSDITNRFSFGVGRHLLAAKLFIFRGVLQLRLFLPVSNVKHHEKAVLEQLTNLYNKNFNPRVKLRRQTLRSSLFRWLIQHGGATPELLGIKPESRMLVVRSTNGATRRREPSIAATETHDDQERWSSEYTHKSFKTPLEDIASRIVQDLRLYRYFLEGKTIELNKSSRESIRHGTNAYAEREADKFIKWKKSEEGAPSNDDASLSSSPTETCSDITALSERHQITLEDLKNKVMGAYDINDKLRMDDLDAFSFTTNGLDEFRNICIPDYDGSLKRCIDKCMNFEIAGLQNVDQKDIDEIISTIKESCGSYGMVIDPKAPMAPLQAMKSIASATLDLKRELDSNQKQLEEKIEKAMQLMHSMIERFDKEDSS
ncbi:unnamed protein product [Cyberlindnera jadinii]|uniref:Uncharacterized protein n=1 Tax=Cyberlindnera jadinii (strain ATCC 18201 / CBS 1600 / BCRC 20928 / JCM 3617 / NBRC 0987 / NRRL Y-1542) TaxID=983966 RepID=A0A0H5C1B9_CYBJN|nr:unnamed protein product [Cyberlindnera jadinii]